MTGRRWWRAVAVTLVASLACVGLGLWQLDRRESRTATIATVRGNWDAVPVALDAALPPRGAALAEEAEYTPVAVSGTYDADATVLVRNRPLDGIYGYYVLVPLRVDGGEVLVVNRGWIPAGASGSAPDEVPAPPAGTVDAVVRLRAPEAGDGRAAPGGQVQRIDVPGTVRDALADRAYPGLVTAAYGQLAAESPRPQDAPRLLPEPDLDPGPHLGYSVQWFVFAAGMWVLLAVQVRRSRGEEAAAGSPSPAAAVRGVRPPVGAARAARSRRGPDEDAEDALLDAAERR